MKAWKVKPTSIKDARMPRNAIHILKKLEGFRNNNKHKQYNKTLKQLKKDYPEFVEQIDQLTMVKPTRPKGQEAWIGVFDISGNN